MSILFKLNGQHLWWPSTGVAIRFLEVLRSLEAHLDCPSGISPIFSDEVTVHPLGLGVFLRACLDEDSLWQNTSLHMLFHGLLAHLFAMMIEHDPTFLSHDDDVPEELMKSIQDRRRAVRLYDFPERPPNTSPPWKYTPCQWTPDQLTQRSDWRVHVVMVNSIDHLKAKIGSHDVTLVDQLIREFEKECEQHGPGANSPSKVDAFRAACEDMIMQSSGSVRETGSWTNVLRVLAKLRIEGFATQALPLDGFSATAFYTYVQFLKTLFPSQVELPSIYWLDMLDTFIKFKPLVSHGEEFTGEFYTFEHLVNIRQILEQVENLTLAGVPPQFNPAHEKFLLSLRMCKSHWIFLTWGQFFS